MNTSIGWSQWCTEGNACKEVISIHVCVSLSKETSINSFFSKAYLGVPDMCFPTNVIILYTPVSSIFPPSYEIIVFVFLGPFLADQETVI